MAWSLNCLRKRFAESWTHQDRQARCSITRGFRASRLALGNSFNTHRPRGAISNRSSLCMHGQIRLKGRHPFDAEEVIDSGRCFVWHATVKMRGLTICGHDSLDNVWGALVGRSSELFLSLWPADLILRALLQAA